MKRKKKVKKKIKLLVVKAVLKLKRHKLKNAIILTSEARSGSTWIMQVLGSLPHTTINWEPLHVQHGAVPSRYQLGGRPLIKEYDTNKKWKRLFFNILTLQTFTDWCIRFIYFKQLKSSKYVVTKFVRANSLLPWLVTVFEKELGRKPILLLRHPITTCASQLKNFHNHTDKSLTKQLPEGNKYQVPNCINNERYTRHQAYLNTLKTPLERKIGLWCVNNMEVLKYPHQNKWITVYYEQLTLDPDKELKKMLENLNLPFQIEDFTYADFKKPSRSNYLKEYNRDATIQLESFLKQLEPAYLDKIQAIFDYFELKVYKAHQAYPVKRVIDGY